jgi:AhpD family alkylhydroperoxidase
MLKYRNQLFGRVAELSKLSPDTVAGYQTLLAAGKKTARLGDKTRELISLAVAVTTRCDGCVAVHAQAATNAGATKEEISEALGVAIAMNAGAAIVHSARALDALAGWSMRAMPSFRSCAASLRASLLVLFLFGGAAIAQVTHTVKLPALIPSPAP